ncbi:type IX secretion/gliding motility protein PorT/SprT [Moheibacter sediminis]|uniref:Probable protein-translocating porin PorT n=1 Tax=Moheibacter sediminis TaxID=1434700 RepID=A0A1W2CU26_9FLAO|nr:porin family protein [Moheibacter sediminis]SMC88745.1 probable protein-translocating porin PorT [Moheibacter sediminis]
MKKLLAFLLFTLTISAFGQFRPNSEKVWHREEDDDKRFGWGYFLGTNIMSFKVVPAEEGLSEQDMIYLRQENKMGFSVGLMAKLKLHNNLDLKLEPGVHFAERNLYFGNIETNETDSMRAVKSTYIDIPFILKVHGDRWVNTRPYLQGGLGYTMNLQSNEKKEEDNQDNIFRMKTHNFNWQVEAGVEIYFSKFKLTPAIKGIFFFNNELVQDNPDTSTQWAGSLKSLSTRGIFFSLKFE